ncbi:MAG TPA: hypothetical protein VG267_02100 [Terracidiphilus sp.]|jgi:hypothetical protein|nr:hypothetical protein [Terracidiphilus sp.]
MRQILRISLLAILGLVLYKPAFTQVAISVDFAPPALPEYDQPPCPEDGWIWVPGYWAWDADDEDYYWVPGTWVAAPEPGYLWTPAWWGWENGAYLFHDGYWATDVGFYGGVNYGYGYFGHGFEGGRWDHDHFFYNTAVVRVNTTVVRNVYVDRTVIVNNNTENHVSFSGGQGGVVARPTAREEAVAHARHVPPPAAQEQRRELARSNPQMRASANQGRPPVAATARPGETNGVAAKSAGAPYHPPANRQNARPGNTNAKPGNENARPENQNQKPANENTRPGNESRPGVNNTSSGHARDLQPHQAPAPPQGNSAADQKYQQQQQKLIEKQNQEHQKLAQQQQQEDQRAQKQQNQQKQQQMEQKHQQQTQQMEQRHQQQQQKMQPHQPQPKPQPKPKEHPQG